MLAGQRLVNVNKIYIFILNRIIKRLDWSFIKRIINRIIKRLTKMTRVSSMTHHNWKKC